MGLLTLIIAGSLPAANTLDFKVGDQCYARSARPKGACIIIRSLDDAKDTVYLANVIQIRNSEDSNDKPIEYGIKWSRRDETDEDSRFEDSKTDEDSRLEWFTCENLFKMTKIWVTPKRKEVTLK